MGEMKFHRLFFPVVFMCLLSQGCANKEMTYFRKHGASVEDERREWGLCGGNFLSDGQVSPITKRHAIECMKDKGYLTLNDYYEEQLISFYKANSTKVWPSVEEMDACGFSITRKDQVDRSCSGIRYILSDRLPKVTQCMTGFGYEPIIPRLGNDFRIIKDPAKLPRLFCLYYSPKSGKGGVSLGGWRLE